jgi:cell division protein FtsW (lipid II flippase)
MNIILQSKEYTNDVIQGNLLKLAGIFLILDALVLTLSPTVRARSLDTPLRWEHWSAVIVWILTFYLIHHQTSKKSPHLDPYLIPIAGILTGWGMISIWRVTLRFGLRQTIWLPIAAVIFIVGLKLSSDLSTLRNYKYLWLFGGLAVTTLTIFFGTNPMGVGPRLWLGCCGVYFQPSEPLKLLLVVYLAAYLADRQPLILNLLSLLAPTIIMIGITLLILVVQRDLGTYTGVIYAATGKKRILLLSFFILVSASIGGYVLFDVVRLRVDAWINPWLDPSGRSYQIVQSLIAQAAGGMGGRGIGMGNPGLVPIAHSDFIFSTISEEFGLIGTLGLFLLLIIFTIRGFRIGIQATNRFHRYLSVGLSVFLASQSLLIIGGNIRLLPLTGVTLPFVSYGGSSLVTSYLTILLLTHINNHSSENPPSPANNIPIIVLAGILIAGFIASVFVNSWWGLIRGPDLLTRTDNARRTISDRYVQRGSILDRNGKPLSESIGVPGEFERVYKYSSLGPVIGYTNPYYGQAGTEASLDPILRGIENQNPWTIWINHLLYGQPPPGLDVRISIDIETHNLAHEMIGATRGAIILMNAENGQIMVMVSNPTYDANQFDVIWEDLVQDETSPLVNRVTQGSYPPESALEPFLFAASELALTSDALLELLFNFGFFSPPDIPLPTTTQPIPETLVIGDMRVSPLQLALGATAINNFGDIPTPHYVIEMKNPAGGWEATSPKNESNPVVSGVVANTMIESFRDDDLPLWKITTIATTDDGEQITWFVGGTTPEAKRNYVVVVVLEEKNLEKAEMIGETLLNIE